MTYDFDKVINRAGTHAVKLEKTPAGSAPFWIADMDFDTAEPIKQAVIERAQKGCYGYTTYSDELKEATQKWFETRHGVHYEKEWMVYAPTVVAGIACLIEALTEPGDGILIQEPVYHPFKRHILSTGRKPIIYNLEKSFGFYTIDFFKFEAMMANPEVKGMILCSPHNPCGRVWTKSELSIMATIAKVYGKFIICDEIHCDLTRNGVVHTPILNLAEDYKDNIAICTAPSKTFNLAGMQLSTIIIPGEEMRKKFQDVIEGQLDLAIPGALSLVAATAAYNEGGEWLDQLKDYLDKNMEFAMEFFMKYLPEAIVTPPEGTYLLWVDLSAYMNGNRWQNVADMMDKCKIFFNDGEMFGDAGKGHIRINVACPKAVLEEGLKRLL